MASLFLRASQAVNSSGRGSENLNSDILTIVIPALNEEGAIAGIVSRCLGARDRIKQVAGLTDVEIIVVSDGSTDRTAEIAQGFEETKVIVFKQNRGYGAAIKEGWRQGRGMLVGFIDADGTCDPNYFADLCRIAIWNSADVVLGSRLGPESKMPQIRRIGNRIFALLLRFLCKRTVTDTASGIRVVRREALSYLYPLPDGMHFTPAMSARALINDLRVIEIPIHYEERVGTSKLSVFLDGVRFLQAIFSGVLCYRPERLFLICFYVCILLILLLAATPVKSYLENGRFEEWMIYRFVVCHLVGSFGLLLLLGAALVNRMAHFSVRQRKGNIYWPSIALTLLRGPALGVIMTTLLAVSIILLWPGVKEYISTRHLSLHWSRLLVGGFCLFSLLQVMVFTLLFKIVSIWKLETTDPEKKAIEDELTRKSVD
jgi:glycosyltransferase involved in cell wall biosynthesis